MRKAARANWDRRREEMHSSGEIGMAKVELSNASEMIGVCCGEEEGQRAEREKR